MVDAVQKLSSILAHTLVGTNQQISSQKGIAVVDAVQKPSSILAHTPVGTKLADYWPEEHRCGRCCSKTKFNLGSHPCGHKTGRFLARRASLWSMLFKNQVQSWLTPLWAQNWQISGQKSIAVVDAVQKPSSILAHTPVGTKPADFWPEEHRCVSLAQLAQRLSSTLASMRLCIHKIGRLQKRIVGVNVVLEDNRIHNYYHYSYKQSSLGTHTYFATNL